MDCLYDRSVNTALIGNIHGYLPRRNRSRLQEVSNIQDLSSDENYWRSKAGSGGEQDRVQASCQTGKSQGRKRCKIKEEVVTLSWLCRDCGKSATCKC